MIPLTTSNQWVVISTYSIVITTHTRGYTTLNNSLIDNETYH